MMNHEFFYLGDGSISHHIIISWTFSDICTIPTNKKTFARCDFLILDILAYRTTSYINIIHKPLGLWGSVTTRENRKRHFLIFWVESILWQISCLFQLFLGTSVSWVCSLPANLNVFASGETLWLSSHTCLFCTLNLVKKFSGEFLNSNMEKVT